MISATEPLVNATAETDFLVILANIVNATWMEQFMEVSATKLMVNVSVNQTGADKNVILQIQR